MFRGFIYLKFTNHLRKKYSTNLNAVTEIPLETFHREAGNYLHASARNGEMNEVIRDMEALGLLKRSQQHVRIYPSLL